MNKRAVISEGSNGRESMQETAATVIVAYGNVRVDVSGSIWRLSPDHALNWSLYPDVGPSVSVSLRMFIIQLIKTLAPDTVTGYFRGMQNCLKAAMSLGADVSDMTGFDIALVGKMRGYINDHVGEASVSWALHAYRKWYQWCSDAGLEGFDARIADALDEIVVGGNRKGDAVLSHDPKLGPLHATEFDRLLSAPTEF
ncbi:hypothetical protein [Burkholderia sp. BCC1638]|uniref:hypothetical protein n=1 Tax=Burkholderia sp. BCC1638 TaxID=2681391 RepID=UPI0015883B4D|nr:hypothetical protein [Burkholderia sp. BCC1638]